MDAQKILTGMVEVDGQRVDYNAPMTDAELNALDTLLGKFAKTSGSITEQIQISTIRQWVAQYASREVK